MNDERFLLFQNSIDEDLLEEAAAYHKQKVPWGRYAALAACFCVMIAGVVAWHPWRSLRMGSAAPAAGAYAKAEAVAEAGEVFDTFAASQEAAAGFTGNSAMPVPEPTGVYEEEADASYSQRSDSLMTFGAAADESVEYTADFGSPAASAAVVNPVRECTLEELADLGFDITLPFGAEPLFSACIGGQIAEVRFIYNGSEYMLREQKTAQSEDISGVYDAVSSASSWDDGKTQFELREGSEGTVLNWYSSEEGTQWCLWSRDSGSEALLETAGEIRGAEITVTEK